MRHITIRRGRDVPMGGAPGPEIVAGPIATRLGLRGSDLPGVRPGFRVAQGDAVAAGQTLFVDRHRPDIHVTAPVAGRVESIALAARRMLGVLEITVEGDAATTFDVGDVENGAGLRALLLESGLWPALRKRPFGTTPHPEASPTAIFVTAIDTNPMAADPAPIIAAHREHFEKGVVALAKLTEGPVFVCQAPGAALARTDGAIECVAFRGRHPAGLPGTHIHHLMPASRNRQVWHIGYQDVIAIGHLLTTGRLWTERVVAVGGAGVRTPQLMRTHPGADLWQLLEGNLASDNVSIISGPPLAGRAARFLGRHHDQVTAISDARVRRRLPLEEHVRALFAGDGQRPLIPVARIDTLLPLDILVVPLLRALSIGDSETAEKLGCLELIEEDLALLAHACPGGANYPELLRRILTTIEAEA